MSKATGLGVLLTATLSMEEMEAWGWRVPLLFGCLIIPVLFWLRKSLHETEAFEKSTHARTTMEILRILGEHWQLIAIGVMAARTRPDQKLKLAALAMIGGGALGNLIDRVREGEVTDFVRWHVHEHLWPIFNVADAALLIGVVCLAIDGLVQRRRATSL